MLSELRDNAYSCEMKRAVWYVDSYVHQIGECAKRSPELIQLLELHTQFAAITPYTQVHNQLTCSVMYKSQLPFMQ